MWFFLDGRKHRAQVKKPLVVIVSPSREIPIRQNVLFGREIARLAKDLKDRKVAFVASADQAHTHRKDGPYGFHPAARKFDELAVRSIEENNVGTLLRLDPKFIEDAKPDSIWQLAILHGLIRENRMKANLFSYQVPTYFGMICAGYSQFS